MTTTATSPEETTEQSAQLRPALSDSRIIGLVGLLSVYFTVAVGSNWIGLHRAYWLGEWRCGARFRFYGTKSSIDSIPRYLLTVIALSAAVAIVVSLIRLARDVAARHRALTTYWLASAVLWVCLASMPLVTVWARSYCGL